MKSLLFVGYWLETWKEILAFLEEKQYHDEEFIKHMKEVLNGTAK